MPIEIFCQTYFKEAQPKFRRNRLLGICLIYFHPWYVQKKLLDGWQTELWTQGADPDKMPYFETSDLSLLCLLKLVSYNTLAYNGTPAFE